MPKIEKTDTGIVIIDTYPKYPLPEVKKVPEEKGVQFTVSIGPLPEKKFYTGNNG